MKLKAFAIFDVKSDSFHTPFFFPATGQAVRAFTDLVADKSTLVARHPSDYKLVQIGEYDDSRGYLSALESHISLGFASDFVPASGLSVVPKEVG